MIILAAGVFDLLHGGHLSFLKKIKNENDKLIVLVNSDRFVSTYKRIPYINQNDRLEMIKNLKIVDEAFICDSEYLLDETIEKYSIDLVYQGSNDIWNYYYHVPINKNIMRFIDYDFDNLSTTKIINKIKEDNKTDFNERYTREEILKSEKLYGPGYQSPCCSSILDEILVNYENFNNILEIGCGLGGNMTYLYNKYKSKITGIDICKNIIDIVNERNDNKNLVCVNVDYNNYNADTQFDMILSRDVFIYLYLEQKFKALKKCYKELEADGTFILIDYCVGCKKDAEFTNYCMRRSWNLIDITLYKKIIHDSGFTIIESKNISNNYINFCNNIINNDNDISDNVITNLKQKLNFLNKENFEWHYFICKK
jgi:cytidyltransferase-like protein